MAQTKFVNPTSMLFQTGIEFGNSVCDFGAGSGFYAIAAAKIVGPNGRVHVADVKEESLDHVMSEAKVYNLRNIDTYLCDLDQTTLPERMPKGSCDAVVLSNIAHEVQDVRMLFKHAYAVLKSGGKALVIDWNLNPGPIGPKAEKRISDSAVREAAVKLGFKFIKNLQADSYHYALILEK